MTQQKEQRREKNVLDICFGILGSGCKQFLAIW